MKMIERERRGGIQRIYRFDNGYGASVIRFDGSYGYEDGLWELAVIQFKDDSMSKFDLVYDTPITSDVLGRLTEEEVEHVLKEIEALKPGETDRVLFELIPEESHATRAGEHFEVYKIKNAPNDADEATIIRAFLASDAYKFVVPYGSFSVDWVGGEPYRLRWYYDTSD